MIKNEKNMRKKIEKKRVLGQSGTLPLGPGNTIRSKVEDELTEAKLKDRESTAHSNTPWAPSGLERIEVAYGKVPLRARGGEDVCKNTWGRGCLQKYMFFKNICFKQVYYTK